MGHKPCTKTIAQGRLAKAREFKLAAAAIEDTDLTDAYITLCVHAGIAASDAICCRELNKHYQGDNHNAAIALLGRIDKQLATALTTLLSFKTAAGYSTTRSSPTKRKQAHRAMTRLLTAADTT